MPKVSVIVPIYNVSAYIERCACSLLEQTLQDMEYIFINDCTPDNSMEILVKVIDKYPNRKSQIHIIHMSTNSGLPNVRAKGIEIASGDYIIHCDSDDWVDVTLYECMYNKAMRSNADIILCPIRDEYKEYGVTRPLEPLPDSGQVILENWYKKSIGMYAWNKLVRRSLYIDYQIFPYKGINMWEDNGLFLRIFYYARGVSTIDDAVYHYNRMNMGAMTHGYGRKAINQMIQCASLIDRFFQTKPDFKRFEKTVLALKFYARINLVTDDFKGLVEYYSTFPESNAIIPEIALDAFSKKGKIRFLFVKYHLAWLFVIIFKVKKIISDIYK